MKSMTTILLLFFFSQCIGQSMKPQNKRTIQYGAYTNIQITLDHKPYLHKKDFNYGFSLTRRLTSNLNLKHQLGFTFFRKGMKYKHVKNITNIYHTEEYSTSFFFNLFHTETNNLISGKPIDDWLGAYIPLYYISYGQMYLTKGSPKKITFHAGLGWEALYLYGLRLEANSHKRYLGEHRYKTIEKIDVRKSPKLIFNILTEINLEFKLKSYRVTISEKLGLSLNKVNTRISSSLDKNFSMRFEIGVAKYIGQ